MSLVHLFARSSLTPDLDATRTDAKDFPSAFGKREPADHHVRAAGGGGNLGPKLRANLAPDFFFDDRNVSRVSIVGARLDPLTLDERRFVDRIHRSAMNAFDPDRRDCWVHHDGVLCQMCVARWIVDLWLVVFQS